MARVSCTKAPDTSPWELTKVAFQAVSSALSRLGAAFFTEAGVEIVVLMVVS
jgi:hypothetical protein